jgi:hypothetical protein
MSGQASPRSIPEGNLHNLLIFNILHDNNSGESVEIDTKTTVAKQAGISDLDSSFALPGAVKPSRYHVSHLVEHRADDVGATLLKQV